MEFRLLAQYFERVRWSNRRTHARTQTHRQERWYHLLRL